MPQPGDSAKDDATYKAQPDASKSYWEKGENDSLTAGQKQKLDEQADAAAKYDKTTKTSGDDFPAGKKAGEIDHGALVRNVKEYVHDRLSPRRDIAGKPAPGRTLGGIVDSDSKPDDPKPPADNPNNDPSQPSWVCVNQAAYMAALLRALGYPVREVTVKLTRWYWQGPSYQEGAIQVWFGGKWHFVDPYTCVYDPKKIIDTYSDYSDTHPYAWRRTDRVPSGTDWLPPRDPPLDEKRHKEEWEELKGPAIGTDLQKLYGLARRPRLDGELAAALGYDGEWISYDPGDARRSGVGIRTPVEGVRLALVDQHRRVTAADRSEIAGPFHLAAGTPIGYVKTWPERELPFEPKVERESVFFGTRSVVAARGELGVHRLQLVVSGPPGTDVPLEVGVSRGAYPVTVHGVPARVALGYGPAVVPFTVVIDPADLAAELVLDSLLRRCAIDAEERDALEELVLAVGQRRREYERESVSDGGSGSPGSRPSSRR